MINKTYKFAAFALVAMLAGIGNVMAEALPATFVAQMVPMKKLLVAGDVVTATLYSDAACSVPIASAAQDVAIENVSLLDSIVQLKIKGVKPAPAKGVRMYFLFDLANPPFSNVYLQVTSAKEGAIVGIPGNCQQQSGLSAKVNGTYFINTNSTSTTDQLPINSGAMANVIFYGNCQASTAAATLYIDSAGNPIIMAKAEPGYSFTVNANTLTVANACAQSVIYTFNVSAGVATISYTLDSPGTFSAAKWTITPI